MRITALLTLFIPLFSACSNHAIEGIAATDTIKNGVLSAPVDVVRDAQGIPHIYGQNPADVAFAEGYVMAQDRLVQMDLARHSAAGTLSELVGDLSPSVIDSDIRMRVHHFAKTAAGQWAALQASKQPDDQATVQMLIKFAAGVNAYTDDLNSGKYSLPTSFVLFYLPSAFVKWQPQDSLMLGLLQAFSLAYDADSEIYRTQLDAVGAMMFDNSTNPANAARKGIAQDFQILAPVDPTYTLPGVDKWTGMNGDTTRASRDGALGDSDGNLLALLAAAARNERGQGHDALVNPGVGSNNWVVGPSLSATGHAMVANDTHLSLSNPPVFYLVHLVSRGTPALNVMGVQFPGIPGVILGMNEHIAWGSTVNYIDVTDVYQETVVPCDGSSTAPCVLFNGNKVPLVERDEEIKVGRFGTISHSITAVLWDVPQHGPIIPRIDASHLTEALDVQPAGGSELSVKYTGHEVAPRLATILYDLASAKSVKEAIAGIDSGFIYGNQNWIFADDQGHIGWTQFTRTPRRSATAAPWKVMPGDGSAEWGADMDPRYIPHAYDPQKGFLATANNDPIGVTDDGDPFFDEPVIDGAPLYLGADYDPGTRVGRITKRIESMTAKGKLTLDDMQAIQADAVSEWAEALLPTFMDAAQKLEDELAHPGTHPDLTGIVATADAPSKMLAPMAAQLVGGWTFDTPDGIEGNPTARQIADSQAATVFMVWMRRFADRTFEDEYTQLGVTPGSFAQLKLLVRMVQSSPLLHTQINPMTGDPILFDIVDTPAQETKTQMAAQAILDTMDYLHKVIGDDPSAWRWGKLHTLTLQFLAPMAALQIPLATDPTYGNGFPRHGDIGTVDAAGDALDIGNYGYDHGPAIRFVAELDPQKGPRARNALPGGEVLDPTSPHYRDQLELWRHNQTFDLAFGENDVAASAKVELMKNSVGRVHFTPR